MKPDPAAVLKEEKAEKNEMGAAIAKAMKAMRAMRPRHRRMKTKIKAKDNWNILCAAQTHS